MPYQSSCKFVVPKLSLSSCLLGALALDFVQPSQVFAQGGSKLEEVVVTARKVGENLQQTPIAVSAYSSETLREIGLEAITSLSVFTPNLQLQRAAGGDSSLVACMRGLCRTDDIITEEAMVGTYVDGFYISRMQGAYFDLLDIQQIEVLRGPQGTLFGKNTAGGAINITTVRPSDEFEGYVVGNLGSDSLYGGKVSVNVPLTDGLAARVSYGQQKRDGLIENTRFSDLNNKDYQTARIALAADVGDRLTADYTFEWFDADQTPNGWQPSLVQAGLDVVFPGLSSTSDPNLARMVSTQSETFDKITQTFNGLTLAYEAGDVGPVQDLTIKSLTGYRSNDMSSFRTMIPYYFLSGPLAQDYSLFTQEFQLLGSALDDRLNIVSGVFISSDEGFYELKQQFGSATPNTIITLETETDTWAAYAELSYQFSDKWKASVGLRYSEEEKKVGSSIFFPSTGVTLPISELAPQDKFETDNVSPRVTVTYEPTDSIMLYAAYAVGFKSGGINGRATGVQNFVVYDDFEITSYEAGIKSDLFDNLLRLNLALFYQELEDWQVQVNSIDPNTFTFLSRIENAAGANMSGAELEATWLVTESFQINGSLGWINSEYDTYLSQDFSTLEFIDVADQYEFQFSPDWTGSVTARYEARLGDVGTLVARVDWSYVDNQYFQVRP